MATDLSQFGLGAPGLAPVPSATTGTDVPNAGTANRPNPYFDSSSWGTVTLGGFDLPGIVESIDGFEKPEEWAVQKGTGANHATTVWRGTKLAEDNKILLKLLTIEDFDGYYTLRDTLRPKQGQKPPSLAIVNPAINFNGVTRVGCKNVGMPKWVKGGGYWTGEITVIEYNPTTTAKGAGVASPAKWKDGGPPSATDRASSELKKLLDEAKRL